MEEKKEKDKKARPQWRPYFRNIAKKLIPTIPRTLSPTQYHRTLLPKPASVIWLSFLFNKPCQAQDSRLTPLIEIIDASLARPARRAYTHINPPIARRCRKKQWLPRGAGRRANSRVECAQKATTARQPFGYCARARQKREDVARARAHARARYTRARRWRG